MLPLLHMRCLGALEDAPPMAQGAGLADLALGPESEGSMLEPEGGDLTGLRSLCSEPREAARGARWWDSGAIRLDGMLWSARPRSIAKAEERRRACDERPAFGVALTRRGPSSFGRVGIVGLPRRRGRSTASEPLSFAML
mmetsp:Transcript_42037/g.108348  ORF Transcript_42037/g.108348 Transcript_42037/m.108348 type:complete len:140 (-) Transcript_42037:411-830(-)